MAIIVRGEDDLPWQEPEAAAAQSYAETPAGGGDAFGGMQFYNPASFLTRRAEQSVFTPHDWFRDMLNANVAAYGGTTQAEYEPSPDMAPENYNPLYAPTDPTTGKVMSIGDKPMPEKLAQTIGNQMKARIEADSAIRRFENAHSWPTNLAVSMAAQMVDPLNIAAMVLPGVGEEAVAARLGITGAGFLGRTAARAASQATFGMAQEVPIAALKMGLAPGENTDYSIRDGLKDILLGGASMAAFGVALGTGGDLLKWSLGRPTDWHLAPPKAREALPEAAPVVTANAIENDAATHTAVAQAIDGKPIDVEDLFPKPPETMIGHGLYGELPGEEYGNLDRDQIARKEADIGGEPNLFRQYDDAAIRRATAARWYQELGAQQRAGVEAETQAQNALRDELAQLENSLPGSGKKRRAEIAGRIAEIKDELAVTRQTEGEIGVETTPVTTGQAAIEQPAALAPQPLPDVSIADLDTEIARLQQKLEGASYKNRQKYQRRINELHDTQERVAQEIGVPNLAPTVAAREGLFQPEPERNRGTTPFVEIPERPLRLTEFLAVSGGVKDQGGDLRQIVDNPNYRPLAKLTSQHGYKPKFPEERFKKLINENGLSLEDAAQRAQDAGYFPEKPDRYENEVDPHELLQAIDADLRGYHRYSIHDEPELGRYQTALEHNHEIDNLAQEHGIDPKGLSREQFFDMIAERQSVADLADEVRERAAHHADLMGELADGIPDIAEGDIVETEHGPLLYEGLASMEDLERAHDEAPILAARQAEIATGGGRPGAATGRAEQGEGGAGQLGSPDRTARGAGPETSEREPGGRAAGESVRSGGRAGGSRIGPSADLTRVQRAMIEADYRMRDLAPRVSEYYRRADERIATLTAHREGSGLLAATQRVNQQQPVPWIHQYTEWQRPDLQAMAEREKAWQETGSAPGIAQPALVREIAAVKEAAAKAKESPQGTVDLKPPKDWLTVEKPVETPVGAATEGGERSAATPGAKTEQATPARPTLAEAYPELDVSKLLPDERAELETALADLTRAEQMQLAFREAGMCLKAAG